MTLLEMPACPFFDDTHTERLDGYGNFYHVYEFSIPSNHPSAELAVPKGLVIFPDLDGDTKCFVTRTVDEESGPNGLYKRCVAEDAAQDELMSMVVAPMEYSASDCTTIVEGLLSTSRWDVGVVEIPDTYTATFEWLEYPTVWECLLEVAKYFGAEVQSQVEVSGNTIVSRSIDFLLHRGMASGQTIEYTKDCAAVTRSGDGGEIYTKVIGLGASQADGTLLQFTDVAWTTAGGDPWDKPETDNFLASDKHRMGDAGDPEKGIPETPMYGIRLDDGTVEHRTGVYRAPDQTDTGWLLYDTYQYFMEHLLPRYTYDVTIAALERMPLQRPGDAKREWESIRVGDTVTVRDTACYPPYQDEVRVIEVRRSYSDPTRDGVVLGVPEKKVSDYLADAVRLRRRVTQREGGW